MDKVLRGLPFATTYVDNILIHSENEDAHKQHLWEVLQRLQEAGLTLKSKKRHMGTSEVSYVGHVFSGTGTAQDAKKIQAVTDWPTLTNASEVLQIIDLALYYCRYIRNFTDIAAPLYV